MEPLTIPIINPFAHIHASVLEQIPELPPSIHQVISWFGQAHVYYRWFKMDRISQEAATADPSRGHPAVYGAGLALVAEVTAVGDYAVNLAITTKCAEDVLDQYRQLSKAWIDLKEAINWTFPSYQHRGLTKKDEGSFFPAAITFWWQVQVVSVLEQMLRITECACIFLFKAFELSMVLQDGYLLYERDPEQRFVACTEIIANWEDYAQKLTDEKDRALEQLEKTPMAQSLLRHFQSTKTIKNMIDAMKEQIQDVKRAAEVTKANAIDTATHTADILYTAGKVTQIDIDLNMKPVAPTLTPTRFFPYYGQTITLLQEQTVNVPVINETKKFSETMNQAWKGNPLVRDFAHKATTVFRTLSGTDLSNSTQRTKTKGSGEAIVL